MQWLTLIFIVSGVANVLLIKWSDIMGGECSDGKWRAFQHPILQAMLMFLAEFLSYLIYKIVFCCLQRRRDGSENYNVITRGGQLFSPVTMLLPAFLDAVASVMLFTGLYLTYATSFQMIRGAALIFVGIFSSIYLNQQLIARHWMAMFTITCGVVVILSIDVQRSFYDTAALPQAEENAVLTGNLLVLCAQILHAAQGVYEEKLLKGADIPPMLAIGWQGIFGLIITGILATSMNFLPTGMPFASNSHSVFDDFADILPQLYHNPLQLVALFGFVISCACYNFVAMSIVKFSSTANRILADGLRVLFIIWITFLLEWEQMNLISVMAFIILEMGAIAYRNAIFIEWYRSLRGRLQHGRYVDLGIEREHVADTQTSRAADDIE